jgi:hypothetical protein
MMREKAHPDRSSLSEAKSMIIIKTRSVSSQFDQRLIIASLSGNGIPQAPLQFTRGITMKTQIGVKVGFIF